MDGAVEIIFSTGSCIARSSTGFVAMVIGLTAVHGIVYMLLPFRHATTDTQAQSGKVKLDKAAVLTLFGLAALYIVVFALAIVLSPSVSSLVANAERIVVNGCASARRFQSAFDRNRMTVTYRKEHGRHSTFYRLILKQKGQRTVDIQLGDDENDEKLARIFPKAMKDYADEMTREGRRVAFDIH